jgi:hypothetical protein
MAIALASHKYSVTSISVDVGVSGAILESIATNQNTSVQHSLGGGKRTDLYQSTAMSFLLYYLYSIIAAETLELNPRTDKR